MQCAQVVSAARPSCVQARPARPRGSRKVPAPWIVTAVSKEVRLAHRDGPQPKVWRRPAPAPERRRPAATHRSAGWPMPQSMFAPTVASLHTHPQEWEPSSRAATQGKPGEQDKLADVRAQLQAAQARSCLFGGVPLPLALLVPSSLPLLGRRAGTASSWRISRSSSFGGRTSQLVRPR